MSPGSVPTGADPGRHVPRVKEFREDYFHPLRCVRWNSVRVNTEVGKRPCFQQPPAQVTGLGGQWRSKGVFQGHGIVSKVQTVKILCLRAAFGFQNISAGPQIHVSG